MCTEEPKRHAQQFFGGIAQKLEDTDSLHVPLPVVRQMYARMRDTSLFGPLKVDTQGTLPLCPMSESNAWQSWMDDPLHSHFQMEGKIAVLVDPFVADSTVEEQVMDVVRTARKSSEAIDATINDTIDTWGSIGLLQYIDIMIWKHRHREEDIPDAILHEIILYKKGDVKARKKHVIGSVTKDHYRRLMLGDELYSLLASAALHARAIPSSTEMKKRRKGKVSIKSS